MVGGAAKRRAARMSIGRHLTSRDPHPASAGFRPQDPVITPAPMMLRQRSLLAAVALGAALVSCKGCGETGPKDTLELADPKSSAVFLAHDLGRLGADLEAFTTRLT